MVKLLKWLVTMYCIFTVTNTKYILSIKINFTKLTKRIHKHKDGNL